jgi:ferric-dicitrate binding protein FerR (iron transport regulator)
MTHSPDPNLLDRYLAGEASPAEIERIEARRKADPEWAETIDALAAEVAGSRAVSWNVDAAWSRLRPKLANASGTSAVVNATIPRYSTPHAGAGRWLVAAAMLAVVAGLMSWVAYSRNKPSAAALAHEIATPNGTRHAFTLDDGTRVTLNAGSRLRLG